MQNKKKIASTTKILYALILGITVGLIFYTFVPSNIVKTFLMDGLFYVIGQGFIRAVQMIVVPLVLFSIMDGVRSMGDTKTLGRVGIKIVVYYLITTALAISIALLLSKITNPGVGIHIEIQDAGIDSSQTDLSITETFINMIPKNPFESMSSGSMLQIIAFALISGMVLATLGGKVEILSNIVSEMNEFMMTMTMMIMKFAPIGVFCLLARTFASLGWDIIFSMFNYIFTTYMGLAFQLIFVYMVILVIFVKANPFNFIKNFIPVMEFAFSTASSNATVPLNITTLEKLGVDKKVSSFTIPLGATINMDGTAIMQGVAVVFVANAYGIQLTLNDYMMVILSATLASIGTSGVPSSGIIMLTMVLQSIGLPTEAIGMLMGVDRLVDMGRTAINITGDAVGTIIVAKQENYFNIEKFKLKV